MSIKIEQPKMEEAHELSSIPIASKRYWGYPEEWIELWREDLAITPQKMRARDYWVGRLEDQLVFVYSISRQAESTCELEDCWMAPEFIGQGYGKILFDHLRSILKAAGCSRLTIVSDPHAEGFYLKMGAVRMGEQESKPKGRMLPLLIYEIG